MPTPIFPPTPAASTEIPAQERPWTSSSSSLESSLVLPPPALQSAAEHGTHSPPGSVSTKPTIPLESINGRSCKQAGSASTKKRRSAALEAEPFILPSPPTRSCRIIQMKPPPPESAVHPSSKRRKTAMTSPSNPQSIHALSSSLASPSGHVNNPGKSTKRSIRKTAHSLIERRRRSKMNDAFSTLKNMVPACRSGDDGKEMHKLDVLNAGIEYLGYLESCLQRMNEMEWPGKTRKPASQDMDRDGLDMREGDMEDFSPSSASESMERQENVQGQQSYYPHKGVRGEKWERRARPNDDHPPSSPRTCSCPCPSHPRNGGDAHIKLLPSPPLPPPLSLDVEPQPNLTDATCPNKNPVRETDRDQEEATSTAAALLMLTSIDRRGNTTNSSSNINLNTITDPAPANSPVTDPISPTPRVRKPFPTSTIRGGLSVRDLLLK